MSIRDRFAPRCRVPAKEKPRRSGAVGKQSKPRGRRTPRPPGLEQMPPAKKSPAETAGLQSACELSGSASETDSCPNVESERGANDHRYPSPLASADHGR